MFRVIVVPRYAVVVQKREEGVSILFQALLVSYGGLALAISAREALEKAIHVGLVSTQESRLQSKPIGRRPPTVTVSRSASPRRLYVAGQRFW